MTSLPFKGPPLILSLWGLGLHHMTLSWVDTNIQPFPLHLERLGTQSGEGQTQHTKVHSRLWYFRRNGAQGNIVKRRQVCNRTRWVSHSGHWEPKLHSAPGFTDLIPHPYSKLGRCWLLSLLSLRTDSGEKVTWGPMGLWSSTLLTWGWNQAGAGLT